MDLKPIAEHSYTWAEGFALADIPEREGGMRQVNWDTVKEIIESNEFSRIEVGMAEDYAMTHANIFKDGKVVIIENDGAGFYGASRWATPAIKLTKDSETWLYESWVSGKDAKFPSWLINMAKEPGGGQA